MVCLVNMGPWLASVSFIELVYAMVCLDIIVLYLYCSRLPYSKEFHFMKCVKISTWYYPGLLSVFLVFSKESLAENTSARAFGMPALNNA